MSHRYRYVEQGEPAHGIVVGDARCYPGDIPEAVARAVFGDAMIDMVNEDAEAPPFQIQEYRIFRASKQLPASRAPRKARR